MRKWFVWFFLGWIGEAEAQLYAMQVPQENPLRATKLSIESSKTRMECTERGAEIRCSLEARYVVRNLAAQTEFAWLFFDSPGISTDVVMFEGSSQASMQSVPAEEFYLAQGFFGEEFSSTLTQTLQTGLESVFGGFLLQVEAKKTTTVTVKCSFSPEKDVSAYDHTDSLIERKHWALAPDWHELISLEIHPAESAVWSVVGDSSFELVVPNRWQFEEGWDTPSPQQISGKKQTLLFSGLTPADQFSVRFRADPPLVQGGGPVLGLGFVASNDPFLFRMGYEAGTSRNAGPLLSLMLDTNFHSRATLTPQIGFGFIRRGWRGFGNSPALSVWMGTPLLVEEGQPLQMGWRTQLDANWRILGFSIPVDVYASEEVSTRVSFLGLLSF